MLPSCESQYFLQSALSQGRQTQLTIQGGVRKGLAASSWVNTNEGGF
jgi:hypothetical protein